MEIAAALQMAGNAMAVICRYHALVANGTVIGTEVSFVSK